MSARTIPGAAALAVLAGTLAAQEPQCESGSVAEARAACNTMVDATRAFHPLAGIIISGGNPVLGTAGGLGGFGRVALTVRVNALKASLPNPDSAAESSVPSSFEGYLPAPVVEGAFGLYAGAVSLDGMVSATLLPTDQVEGLDVDTDAPKIGSIALGFGYGVRLGILRGSFPIPGVSVSVMRRRIPRVQFGDVAAGDIADFATDLSVTSVRVVAGWRFAVVDVAAGLGVDRYASTATIRYRDLGPPLPTTRTATLDLRNRRQVAFLNAALSLGPAKLVGELGYQNGKDQGFTTNFSDFDPTAGHTFGGIGLRFAL
jgi:hypothetical protein